MKDLIFVVRNDGTYEQVPNRNLRAQENYSDNFVVIANRAGVVKAKIKLLSRTDRVEVKYLVPSLESVEDLIGDKSYFQDYAQASVWRGAVPKKLLQEISMSYAGQVEVSFSFTNSVLDSRALVKLGELSEGDLPESAENGEYYIIRYASYTKNDITWTYGQQAIWEGEWIKGGTYKVIGTTTTHKLYVEQTLIGEQAEFDTENEDEYLIQLGEHAQAISELEIGVDDHELRISTNEQDINKIEDGTTVIDKALKDDLGNTIKSTYANKLDLVYSSSNNRIAITLKSYDGTSLDADLIDLPKATTSADGLLAKEDKVKINNIASDIASMGATKQNLSEKNQINGYAGLDSNAKIPSTLLPDSILGQLEYKGTFTPTAYPSSPEKGWFYISIGNGTISGVDFQVGDWAVFNGSTWDKVDNTDAVMSVNGKIGVVILNGTDIKVGNGDAFTIEQRIVNIYAELNNRYTKAQTYSQNEIEQRLTDLLGMANLQDILIGSYTNGQTVLASDLSAYNFVIALGKDLENTYTGTFKPSEIVSGNVISLSSTVYLTRGATDFTITTPTSVKLWGIKLDGITADEIGYDGTISGLSSTNVKTAIDELALVMPAFDTIRGTNLLNPADVDENCYYTLGGMRVSTDIYRASGLIEVNEGDIVTMQKDDVISEMRFVTAYNDSKEAVSASGEERSTAYTVPAGIKYIRVSGAKGTIPLENTMICFGTTLKPFEVYYGYKLVLKANAFNSQIVYDINDATIGTDIDIIDKHLDLTSRTTIVNGWKNATWKTVEVANYNSVLSAKVRCNVGQVFGYRGRGNTNVRSWAFFDKDDNLLSTGYADNADAAKQSYYLITAPENAYWVQFASYYHNSGTGTLELVVLGFDGLDYLYAKHEKMIKEISSQEIVFSTGVGYFGVNGGFNALADTSCIYTNLIKTSEGEKFIYRGIGRSQFYSYVVWNSEGTIIARGQHNSPENNVEITMPENACWVRFGSSETDANGRVVQLVCYRKTKEHKAIENFENLANSNVLWGKKYVACGDSFTEWSTEKFVGGRFDTRYKVYPFFIGLRNNMTVVNEAISGSIMTNLSGSTSSKFSVQRYKDIPADADYITLYFGINDEHQNAPIGTIDDADNTTFYGAWNVVMEYLITNHPFAKIGIIITNGANNDYANAEIAIAKKWGVPYLDINGGYQVPLMLRTTGKSEVCQTAKDLRLSQQRAAVDNHHPNAQAHEYESTFIENFLRTL